MKPPKAPWRPPVRKAPDNIAPPELNSPVAELSGSIKRITFANPENGWTVLRLTTRNSHDDITVVGHFSNIQVGETLRLTGRWVHNPTYGLQFQATQFEVTRPATEIGIEKYLASNLIKGIGPIMARRIVKQFGLATLDIIETAPERLAVVPGISSMRIDNIKKAWAEQKEIRNVMVFLQRYGISTHFAVKIFKFYGEQTIKIIEQNPYQLARDIYGIGFKSADRIALQLGLTKDSPLRLRAGITHVLFEATEEGHCFLPVEDLITRVDKALETTESWDYEAILLDMAKAQDIYLGPVPPWGTVVYATPFYVAERAVAARLRRLAGHFPYDRQLLEKQLLTFGTQNKITLSVEQRNAIYMAFTNGVSVITGGPGCGKTTTLWTLVKLLKQLGKRVHLASPTGRAAQRLMEVTQQPAKTIHRLLEFDPSTMGFKHNQQNPLDGDFFIIDEASMIDILLGNNLLKAIPLDAQVCFVGDADQLPSVGPGQFLADLIKSEALPVTRLNEIFRQAASSRIIAAAHRINGGEVPFWVTDLEKKSDCFFVELEEPEAISQQVLAVVAQEIPARFGFSLGDIQVLAPMKRGTIGVTNLNLLLQARVNPPTPQKLEIKWGPQVFRQGDRVIQQVNNYDLEVFNGDIGKILAVDLEDKTLLVEFSERQVMYDFDKLNELTLAYAISVHRSQGSEYPVVVLPLHFQYWNLLNRAVLYTGLTRAKKLAIIVGQGRAAYRAITTDGLHRYTNLQAVLNGTAS